MNSSREQDFFTKSSYPPLSTLARQFIYHYKLFIFKWCIEYSVNDWNANYANITRTTDITTWYTVKNTRLTVTTGLQRHNKKFSFDDFFTPPHMFDHRKLLHTDRNWSLFQYTHIQNCNQNYVNIKRAHYASKFHVIIESPGIGWDSRKKNWVHFIGRCVHGEDLVNSFVQWISRNFGLVKDIQEFRIIT